METAANESSLSAPSPSNLALLIDGMRRGDERALEELYDATVGKVYALASAVLRNDEDAEEIVCSTFAYAWSNANRFDGARANALGWLLMLCRSRALDRLRQRRTMGTSVDVDTLTDTQAEDSQPEDMLSLLQQRSRVRIALSNLVPERRHLISMAFLKGMSHQEIADATGISLGTVKSHVRRALQQLRAELETP